MTARRPQTISAGTTAKLIPEQTHSNLTGGKFSLAGRLRKGA
jgi:hypothetical protein